MHRNTTLPIRGILLSFTLIVTTTLIATITHIFYTDTGRHLWNSYTNYNSNQNSPCFTVGFAIRKSKNRLENYLFYYAGIMYVAWLTGRKPQILTSKKNKTRQSICAGYWTSIIQQTMPGETYHIQIRLFVQRRCQWLHSHWKKCFYSSIWIF